MDDSKKPTTANKANAAPPQFVVRGGRYDDCESLLELMYQLGPSIEDGLMGDHEGKGVSMVLDEHLYRLVKAVKANTHSASDNTDKIIAAIDRLTSAVRETAVSRRADG